MPGLEGGLWDGGTGGREDAQGGFHLHLLVFPFVYQFNSRIGVLVHTSFAND